MTPKKERPKILDMVRKLHAHAESAKKMGSTKEAEAFAARVAGMMAEHKIEMTDLEMTELVKLEPVGQGESIRPAGYASKRVAWVEDLAAVIGHAHYCTILVVKRTSVVILVGRQSDREIAEWMINWMTPWLWKLSHKEMMAARKRVKAEGNPLGARGFRISFINGFIDGLRSRYSREQEEQIQAAQARGTSHALVRVDTARQAVLDWVKENAKGKAAPVGQRSTNWSGVQAGRKAAQSVNLNRPVSEGSKVRGLL